MTIKLLSFGLFQILAKILSLEPELMVSSTFKNLGSWNQKGERVDALRGSKMLKNDQIKCRLKRKRSQEVH